MVSFKVEAMWTLGGCDSGSSATLLLQWEGSDNGMPCLPLLGHASAHPLPMPSYAMISLVIWGGDSPVPGAGLRIGSPVHGEARKALFHKPFRSKFERP